MAKYGSDKAWLLVDGYKLTTFATAFDDEAEGVLEETTGLGLTWPTHDGTGLRKFALKHEGFYDDDANASNEALSGQQQTSRIVCAGVQGLTIGRKFTAAAGMFASKYTRKASRGELHKASAQYTVSGEVVEGVILQDLVAKAADWNSEGADSQDAGASSANGGTGVLQVTDLTGFTGFVGKIRHSADDTTYADLITFSNVTAAPGAQRSTVAGTVNRHLAFDGNVTGTGSITVMAGFARG